MHKFDQCAVDTIKNLSREFNIIPNSRPDYFSEFSMGIEIEVKFRYFFPELFQKYFSDYNSYTELSYEEKDAIDAEIEKAEESIQEKLKKTVQCGIPKGVDKYWEFAFTPVYNISYLITQVDILNQAGLIPKGKHSLHITLGNTTLSPRKFWILLMLELLYCDKNRIQEGFSKKYKTMSATWATKGESGILHKKSQDLLDSDSGVELRTLQFDGTADTLYDILTKAHHLIMNDQFAICEMRREAWKVGLPDANWGNPHSNPDVWNKYIQNFDNLAVKAKELILL